MFPCSIILKHSVHLSIQFKYQQLTTTKHLQTRDTTESYAAVIDRHRNQLIQVEIDQCCRANLQSTSPDDRTQIPEAASGLTGDATAATCDDAATQST